MFERLPKSKGKAEWQRLFGVPVPKPFRNARWVFWFLLLMWIWLSLDQICREGPPYLEIVVITFTICVVFWINHVNALQANVGSTIKLVKIVLVGGAYDLLVLFGAVLLCFVPISIIAPSGQCYSNRARVDAVVASASALSEEISARALLNKSLTDAGLGMNIIPDENVTGGVVTKDGIIIMASKYPAAVVIFSPEMKGKEVAWKCIGFPAKYVPVKCRGS